jgi:hypothetical protein
MKIKGLLLALGVIGLPALLSAQMTAFGIQFGANIGTPIGKAAEGATGAPGVGNIQGLAAQFRITDFVGLQSEFHLSYKNASFSTPISGDTTIMQEVIPGVVVPITTYFNGNVAGNFENIYLELPLMAKLNIKNDFSLLIGPYFGYLARASNTGLADVVIGNNFRHDVDVPFDQSQFLNPWDYGAVLGVQYDAVEGFNMGIRMTTGLRSIYQNSYTQTDGPVRNVYLQGSIGYFLRAGGS